MIGTLGEMTSTQLNNIYTHEVKKTWKQEKAAFENIIRTAAARIAATTLRVFESLRFEETGRFVSFTADETVPQWPLVQLYLLHPTSYHNSNNLRNHLLLYEGANLNYKGKLSCHDPIQVCFQETRERVTMSAAKGHICKLVQILVNEPSKGV